MYSTPVVVFCSRHSRESHLQFGPSRQAPSLRALLVSISNTFHFSSCWVETSLRKLYHQILPQYHLVSILIYKYSLIVKTLQLCSDITIVYPNSLPAVTKQKPSQQSGRQDGSDEEYSVPSFHEAFNEALLTASMSALAQKGRCMNPTFHPVIIILCFF